MINNYEPKMIDEGTLNAISKMLGKSQAIMQLYRG